MDSLEGIRVLEFSDDLGAYAGKVLAELGADVLRVEPRLDMLNRLSIDPDVTVGRFLHRSKRVITLNPDSSLATEEIEQLISGCDVVIDAGSQLASYGIDRHAYVVSRPELIWLRVTPHGQESVEDQWSSDLTCSAAGGFLGLGGWPDRAPTRAYGDQTWRMASLYAAAGALVALYEREASGHGQEVDVAADEAAATGLENALQFFDLEGQVRKRVGAGYAEAGSGVYASADGHVFLMVGRLSTRAGWANLVQWMVEDGALRAEELRDAHWQSQDYRTTTEGQTTFREIFEGFSTRFGKAELYLEGQRRSIALAPINSPTDLISNEQLAARGFFGEFEGEIVCGPPYRLGATPWRVGIGEDA